MPIMSFSGTVGSPREITLRRMHIAHFTNFYHPVVNGVVRSVSAFRQGLSELGHNAFVFAQHSPDYEDEEPFIFRYPAVNLPLQIDVPAAIPISPSFDRVLPSLKLDVIHTHHPFLLGQVAAVKSEELGVPLVFTFHTRYRDYTHYFPLPQEAVQEFVKSAITTWLAEYMEKCHHIVVPSNSFKEILEEGFGLTERVTVIPTGIQLEPYQQADGDRIRAEHGWTDEKILVSVGRLAPEKNWQTLLKAAAGVIPEVPKLRVLLIGDGSSKRDLVRLAGELGIGEQVIFLGEIPFEQVPGYLKAADLFGFASVTETQGLVTMEALAAGLPVAAVDAPGTRDGVTHGKEALLTKNDSAELAHAIRSLLQDEALYAQFKQAAIEKANSFEIKNVSQRLVDVYLQAIEDQRSQRHVRLEKTHKLFKIDWKRLPSLS